MPGEINNDPIANKWLYFFMTVMLISGALNTIFSKLQIEVTDRHGNRFKHPYIMNVVTFMAGSINMFIYLLFTRREMSKFGSYMDVPEVKIAATKGKKPYISEYWLAIPASMDYIAVPLMNFGLILVDASVYQMLRGGLIFITAMLSIIFLKARLHRHHWTALFFIIGGVTLVGVSSVKSSHDSENVILGIVLIILSQIFSAFHWIIEEKILRVYYIHPFKMVGWEGLWACLMSVVTVFILQFITCHGQLCPDGKVDNAKVALEQAEDHFMVVGYAIFLLFTISTFQISGLWITKYGSAAQRWTIDIARIILIWMFFLAYQGQGHEKFDLLELIGFFGIVIGTVLYNEIYVPSLFGFDKNTKANILKRKMEESNPLLDEKRKANLNISTS